MKCTRFHVCYGIFAIAVVLLLACSSHAQNTLVYPTINCSSNSDNTTLDKALKSLDSETQLDLLPGVHCITAYTLISNLVSVKIIGKDRENVTIICAPGNGLAFLDVTNLTINGVTVKGCGLSQERIYEFKRNVTSFGIDFFFTGNAPNDSIAILCAECNHFNMSDLKVIDTNGLGFLGINVQGDSLMDNVHFIQNSPKSCFHEQVGIVENEQIGGGAIFTYHDYNDNTKHSQRTMLSVSNSNFSYNSYCGIQTLFESYYRYSEVSVDFDFLLGAGGGLSIVYTQLQYSVNTTIESCHFQNNTAKYGGGAQVQIFSGVFDSHVVFEECVFKKNGLGEGLYSNFNYTTSGSALAFFIDFLQPNFSANVNLKPPLLREPSSMTVIRSNFTDNVAFSGGAVIVLSLFASLFGGIIQDSIFFEKCRFENNVAIIGSAMYVQEWKEMATQRGLNVDLNDVMITNNTVVTLSSVSSATKKSAVVEVLSVNVTIRGTTRFQHNLGTAIRCASGILHFQNDVTFFNNSASYAGALRIDQTGIIIVNDNTNLVFRNNTGAVYGGAIVANYLSTLPTYVHNDCFLYFGVIDISCFADITINCPNVTELNISIEFEGNTAPLGGVLFGSTLETCPWASKLRMETHLNASVSILEFLAQPEDFGHNITLFKFGEDQMPNTITTVTTPTSKIDLETRNGHPINILDVEPGQTLNIYVKLLDRFNRPIPGVLTSRLSKISDDDDYKGVQSNLGESNYWFLEKPKEHMNNSKRNSFRTPITINGNLSQDNFNITLFALDSLAQTEFTINLTDCSPGFEYDEASAACVCDQKINDSRIRIECESDGRLSVSSEVWIGYGPDDYLTILACQYDYCQSGSKKVKPPDFDYLCRVGFNRTGIACGQCAENYSIIFGSNECKKCSNYWLFYAPIFLLQGISVICAICFLRITISEGYLNGVLFYSNVVSIYLPVFSYSTNLSTVFVLVSWLNLDWGIPTCFYDGMTALESTALEFFFPLYLYILMVCIILIARHSKAFTNWFVHRGFSATKLFVTLILMTYTSLLQTCVEILGATAVTTFNNKTYIQWTRDPNQGYFRDKHIPLGLIAILLLIFFLIPLPCLLIFPAIVFKVKFLKRFKPIYDALWAPFKPTFRFWVGLRLLLRGFPIVFLSFLPHPLNVLMLAMFVLTLFWVQSVLQPFRGPARNAFDNFFLANILVLAVGYLYFYIYLYDFNLDVPGNAIHLTTYTQGYFYSVVFTAYVAFTLIIIWHIVLCFPKLKKVPLVLIKRLRNKVQKNHQPKDRPFSVNSDGDTRSYGATSEASKTSEAGLDTENDTEDGNGRQKVTYSELREPLLESGSLEQITVQVTET